jgi:hypothetical protein
MTETWTDSFSPEHLMGLAWPAVPDRINCPDMTRAPLPVPGELVHKNATEQVFLTGGVRTGELRFLIDAVWPKVHPFYRPDEFCTYDSSLVGETLRQATYYVTHTFCDVPLFWSFILGDIEWRIVDRAAFRQSGAFVKMTVELACTHAGKWTRLRRAFRVNAVFRFRGRVCATAGLLAEAIAPRIYQSLRRRSESVDPKEETSGTTDQGDTVDTAATRSARRLAPMTVGRHRDGDVVIGDFGTPGSWQVLVDCTHPIMFDHPLDHLPGMLLLEAGRQAGFTATEAIAGRPAETLLSCRAQFTSFCEIGQDTIVHAELKNVNWRQSVARFHIRITQRGRDATTGVFEYSFGSGADR